MNEKKRLRAEAKAVRKAIPAAVRSEKSAAIFDTLTDMPAFQAASDVFCFVSFRDEVETRPILEHLWKQGQRVYIPFIDQAEKIMRASRLDSLDELAAGYYGVMEQKDEFVRLTPAEEIDLVITPGLLFDREGYRVGYGGGFFDGFFASFGHPAIKIGICFEEQIRTRVPRAPHDIPVDWIVTDAHIYDAAMMRTASD